MLLSFDLHAHIALQCQALLQHLTSAMDVMPHNLTAQRQRNRPSVSCLASHNMQTSTLIMTQVFSQLGCHTSPFQCVPSPPSQYGLMSRSKRAQ